MDRHHPPLMQAMSAALDRLDSLEAHGRSLDYEHVALAFVGFDVGRDELMRLGNEVSIDYGEPLLIELQRIVELCGDGPPPDTDVFNAGVRFGQIANACLHGVFALGLLVGELHREQTIRSERKAPSEE